MPSRRLIPVCVSIICIVPPTLRAQQTLRVSDPIVSRFEDGPAMGGERPVPGETVFFRFRAPGFKAGEGGKVHIKGVVQAFDPRGMAVSPPDEVVIGTSLSEQDKDWSPWLRSQVQVPPIAPGGTYRIHYEATDQQTHQTASGDTTFAVAGRNLSAGPDLAIREFGFYRTADDETPLKVPAYRSGDMVWVRFFATGYKLGEQNAIDVAYDVAVVSDDGRRLFSQEDAAGEKSQAFYPQPWVPGSFSLTLQANMMPGSYTVEITARDGIGKQAATEKAVFRVE